MIKLQFSYQIIQNSVQFHRATFNVSQAFRNYKKNITKVRAQLSIFNVSSLENCVAITVILQCRKVPAFTVTYRTTKSAR